MLHANLQDYPLQVHTKLTRQQASKTSTLFQHLPEAGLTHFITGLQLPPSRPALIEISVPKVINGQTVRRTIAMKIHVPPAGRALALQTIRETEDEEIVLHPKLALLGDSSSGLLKANADLASPPGIDEYISPFDTAVALLFHHPGLINLSESDNGKIPAYIIERIITRAIGMSNTLPYVLEELGDDWATEKPVMRELADGKTEHMRDPDNPELFLYTRQIHPNVMIEVESALKEALIRVQQDAVLQGQQWDVQYGIGADSKTARTVKSGENLKAGASKWALSNKTPGNGLTISPVIRVEPHTPGKGNYKGTGIWTNDIKYEKIKVLDAEMLDLLLKDKILLRIAVPAHPGGIACLPVKVERKGSEGPYVGVINFSTDKMLTIKAVFTLNSYKTGLDYTLDCTNIDSNASADLIVMQGDTQEVVKRLDFINTDGDTFVNYINIECTNHWVRHLGAFVQFLDGDEKPIPISKNWTEQLPEFLSRQVGRDYEPALVLLERIQAEPSFKRANVRQARSARPRRTHPATCDPDTNGHAGASHPGAKLAKAPRENATDASVQEAERPISIDDTDRDDVMAVIREVFASGGSRSRDQAIRDILNQLGYQRGGIANRRDSRQGHPYRRPPRHPGKHAPRFEAALPTDHRVRA